MSNRIQIPKGYKIIRVGEYICGVDSEIFYIRRVSNGHCNLSEWRRILADYGDFGRFGKSIFRYIIKK